MNNDKHLNFEIKSFIIFDPTLSLSDEEEHKKILYYHPKSIDFEQRMKTIGLCEAMGNFATEFTDSPCQFIHTMKTRIIMHTMENKMTIIMTVNIPKKSANSEEYLEEQVQNSICSVILQHCRQMFFLFVGPPSYIIKKGGMEALTDKLQRFFDRYIGQGMLDGYQVTDGLPGVQLLPTDKEMYHESEIVINRLEAKYSDIIASMLLFNNNLVYYTIDKDDLGIFYRHLTTSLLAKHNLGDSLDYSFKSLNMGRYIKWSEDPGNFCNSTSKTVFLKNNDYLLQKIPKPKEALFYVYKALQATMVFFIDKESLPTNDYLNSIDEFLGQDLTKLANLLTAKSAKFSSESPYKYMYWNPRTLSIKCTLFPTRQWKSDFPPLVPSDTMQVMTDIKQEFDRYEEIHKKSIKEMAVKLQSDSWVVAIQSNNKQMYVAINKRNFSLVDVSKEMQHVCNRDFPNVFKSSINPLACCSYILCRRNDQFNPVPLNDLDANSERVKLDTSSMGQQAVVVKNGKRICGSGAALANCHINQNKAYFEVKIQSSGTWGIGLATPKVNLDKVPLGTDKESWVLKDNSTVWHNNEQICKLDKIMVQEGDVIGISYDHVEMCIWINGKHAGLSVRGMRGSLYPTVYVDDGAILDVEFSHFRHDPPYGFSEILFEKQLL